MAIDFDMRDPKNQKLIMTFLIPIVILAAAFQFLVKPLKEKLDQQKVELTNVQNQIDMVRRSLKSPKELEAEKGRLTAKLGELEALLPNDENVAVLLTQFSMVERESNVYLVGFDAAETVEGGEKPYKSNKYRMTIEAGYHQFADFVSRVMTLPRIMSFSDLRISINPNITEDTEFYEGMENQPRNLTVECMLTTYLFQEIVAEDANGKTGK